MKVKIFLFGFIVAVVACNNPNNKVLKVHAADSTSSPQKVRDIEPTLWKADSLQILYYDNPDGDSLRYARFFSFIATNDSVNVNGFLNELNQVYVQQNNRKDCRSEGKLFLLSKEDVLKTIYFSTHSDSCSYMYFIKDGSFVYLPLTEDAKKFLAENKRFARKP